MKSSYQILLINSEIFHESDYIYLNLNKFKSCIEQQALKYYFVLNLDFLFLSLVSIETHKEKRTNSTVFSKTYLFYLEPIDGTAVDQ